MNAAGAPAAALTLPSADEDSTLRRGAQLAQCLVPLLGDLPRALVVTLSGPLGAGKTTLVRGLLAACGVTSAVRSPSYALLEHYVIRGGNALHVDLYRLADPEEVEGLGLRDYDVSGTLWLVEWPEKALDRLPTPDLRLQLAMDDGGHTITATAGSPQGLAALRQPRLLAAI